MRKILIVDDEADIREVAELCFEVAGGWDVALARSGREAVEMARTDPPDVILMDVMMPEMDGPTTVKALRAEAATTEIPILLLTAKVQSTDRRQFDDLDILGVIPKPFDPMALASEVEDRLERG